MLYEYLAEELPPVLTVEQLRAFLGIGRNAAYTLVHSDTLPVVLRVGRRLLIPRHAVLQYLGLSH